MKSHHPTGAPAPCLAPPLPIDPPTALKLEKVSSAAARMSVSTCHVYRQIKAGNLRLVKIGVRASAIPSADVDAWIADKLGAVK